MTQVKSVGSDEARRHGSSSHRCTVNQTIAPTIAQRHAAIVHMTRRSPFVYLFAIAGLHMDSKHRSIVFVRQVVDKTRFRTILTSG